MSVWAALGKTHYCQGETLNFPEAVGQIAGELFGQLQENWDMPHNTVV